jgi:hypothetical protein
MPRSCLTGFAHTYLLVFGLAACHDATAPVMLAAAEHPTSPAGDPDCEEASRLDVQLDEVGTFGASPNQLAAHLGEAGVLLDWGPSGATFEGLDVHKPSGKTKLEARLENLMRAAYVRRTYKPPEFVGRPPGRPPTQCPDQLELEGVLRFVTEDGGFDEHWPVVLDVASGADFGTYVIDLDRVPINGSFRLSWGQFEDGASKKAFITGALPGAGQATAAKLPGPSSSSGFSLPLAVWGDSTVTSTGTDGGGASP